MNTRDEVMAYLAAHPGAKSSDVAMECNLTRDHARRLMNAVRQSSQA